MSRVVKAVEVGEYGDDAAVGVVGLGDVEFREDVSDVCFDGALAHDEATGDSRVGQSFRHELQDAAFAVRYDLRDSGESTTVDPEAPGYTLRDLGADAAALADALGDGPARLAGIGVGGMVAQLAALEPSGSVLGAHPGRHPSRRARPGRR